METKKDYLQREAFINRLVSIINLVNNDSSNQKGSISIAVNGQWGCGKSFVLDLLEEKISPVQSMDTFDNRYHVIRYNCWENDYYQEPSIALISAVLEQITELSDKVKVRLSILLKEIRNHGIDIVKAAAKERWGEPATKVIEILDKTKSEIESEKKKQEAYDENSSFNKIIKEVRKSLESISEEKTIVLLIDELDRCQPSYAITVLERLHHVFYGLKNCIMILAIDQKQLNESIKQIFGTEVSVDQYMRKFVDLTLSLDNGSPTSNLENKFSSYFCMFSDEIGRARVAHSMVGIFKNTNLDMRTQEKIIELSRAGHKLACSSVDSTFLMLFEVVYVTYKMLNKEFQSDSQSDSINNSNALHLIAAVDRSIEGHETYSLGHVDVRNFIKYLGDKFSLNMSKWKKVHGQRTYYHLEDTSDVTEELLLPIFIDTVLSNSPHVYFSGSVDSSVVPNLEEWLIAGRNFVDLMDVLI